MTRKIRLDVQYVGTAYAGWQLQPESPTIQGTIEQALERLFQSPVRIHGSGRTDAGVHAVGQVAHFETGSTLPVDRIRSALNHFLPWDIRVTAAADVPADFHARESALAKEYRYRVYCGDVMPPCLHPFALLEREPLDLAAMRRAAAALVGTHDFASLQSAGSSVRSTVRTVRGAEWMEQGPELVFRIEADGFLYKMVRTIVGTLLEVGRGRRPDSSVTTLTRVPDRGRAGFVASAHGLHLWSVRYDAQEQDRNRRREMPQLEIPDRLPDRRSQECR